MKKKIMFLLISIFISISNIYAFTYSGCDYSTVAKIKSLVTNVNISYDYHIEGNYVTFDVTLVNITPGMSFTDTLTRKKYTYADTNNGEITISGYSGESGSYKFYSTISGCEKILYGTKYYSFPIYNEYYTDPLCKEEYPICKKWVKSKITHQEFTNAIKEYTKPKLEEQKQEQENNVKGLFDYIIDFYVKYYYIILLLIIITCSSIIYIKRKKDRFKF